MRSFEKAENAFVLLGTRKGVVKKTKLDAYANPRRGGIIAINLGESDELIAAAQTTGDNEVIIASRKGKSIRFRETDVRPMGRTAAGVRGMGLAPGDEVVGMEVLEPGATILTVTERGYGKRTPVEDYRLQGRGGSGIINIRTSERNGKVVACMAVDEQDQILMITAQGKIIRFAVDGVSRMGRATQGVRLIHTEEGDNVASAIRTEEEAPKPNSDSEEEQS